MSFPLRTAFILSHSIWIVVGNTFYTYFVVEVVLCRMELVKQQPMVNRGHKNTIVTQMKIAIPYEFPQV